jgi:hypothetical protein
MPTPTSGSLLVATGILHNAVGLLLGFGLVDPPGAGARNLVAEMVAAGVWNSVEPDPWRMTFFWFEFVGALAIVLGALMHGLEKRDARLPAWLGWAIGLLGAGGVVLLPASGLWLLLPQGWLVVRRARTEAG